MSKFLTVAMLVVEAMSVLIWAANRPTVHPKNNK